VDRAVILGAWFVVVATNSWGGSYCTVLLRLSLFPLAWMEEMWTLGNFHQEE